MTASDTTQTASVDATGNDNAAEAAAPAASGTPDILYRDPVLLDKTLHRRLKAARMTDYSVARGMHAMFVAAAEFESAALDYVIVFVRTEAGADTGAVPAPATPGGRVAPIVMLGTNVGENLHLDGPRWDSAYVPAFIRRYPFWAAEVPGGAADGQGASLLIDRSWSGWSEETGEPLFVEADGSPAPALQQAIEFMRSFEFELQRTNTFCARLVELGLLREMKADATLADGSALAMTGFLAVDRERLAALPEAAVVELHASGMLGLLHVHLLSLGNLRKLIDRKARSVAAAPAAQPAAT